jgi:acetoin utilization protein AcuB
MSVRMLTARDLMTPRVVTIGMDDTLKTARRVFEEHRFHHLIVLDRGTPVGVLSDRDLLKHLSPFVGSPLGERPQDAATLKKRVHQMMTRKLIAIGPDASLGETGQQMLDKGVSCLPVVDPEEGLLGIVTIRDLARLFIADHLETQASV